MALVRRSFSLLWKKLSGILSELSTGTQDTDAVLTLLVRSSGMTSPLI